MTGCWDDEPTEGTWEPLPAGYVLPGVHRQDAAGDYTVPVPALCGHATRYPAGWSVDCAQPAAYAHRTQEGKLDEYACAGHHREAGGQS